MNSRRKTAGWLAAFFLMMILVISSAAVAFAGDQSDDNSLTSLGITTQGVTVSPDFSYDHLTYDVVVPAGTTELQLDPVLSNPNATINSIDGTTLTDGTGTVTITITAPSGAMTAYTLNVTTAPDTQQDPATAISEQEAQKTTETAAQSETQAETQTEDSRYVKVDKNTLQDAEDTISRLQSDLQVYKDRSHTFTYVIYVLIAVSVILLFFVVNLLLRKKDLASELNEYKKHHKMPEGFDDTGDVIPEGGWLDDEPDEPTAKKQKKSSRKKAVPQYRDADDLLDDTISMTPDGRVNSQTSWTKQQVGTPVEPPKEYVPYNGYARGSQKTQPQREQTMAAAGRGSDPRQRKMPQPQSRKTPQGAGVSDETRRYSVPQGTMPVSHKVPGDETIVLPTKKLSRAEKAAAKKAEKEARKAQRAAQESKWKKAPEKNSASFDGRQEYPGVMRASDEVKDHSMPGTVSDGQSDPWQIPAPSAQSGSWRQAPAPSAQGSLRKTDSGRTPELKPQAESWQQEAIAHTDQEQIRPHQAASGQQGNREERETSQRQQAASRQTRQSQQDDHVKVDMVDL